jgi:katanin p60 ATPase-containing subunit A1
VQRLKTYDLNALLTACCDSRGDSEKLVRVLFELARYHTPSTIFLDEIDAILSSRSGGDSTEHEASRRMKTELLIQMDGLAKSNALVFVLAASNLPWDLDAALLRRLEKRVLVPLPGSTARLVMLRKYLAPRINDESCLEECARKTEGYSGADMELVCREAAMQPVRRLVSSLRRLDPGQNHDANSKRHVDVEALLRGDPVSKQDLEEALIRTRMSSDGNIERYRAWDMSFGSA